MKGKQMNRRGFFAVLAGLPVAALAVSRGDAKPLHRGGPVNAGKPYIIGERGPEMLLTANQARALHGLSPLPR